MCFLFRFVLGTCLLPYCTRRRRAQQTLNSKPSLCSVECFLSSATPTAVPRDCVAFVQPVNNGLLVLICLNFFSVHFLCSARSLRLPCTFFPFHISIFRYLYIVIPFYKHNIDSSDRKPNCETRKNERKYFNL